MVVNLYDYEVLARQKREAMLAEAEQRRALDRATDTPKRRGARALVGGLLARFKAIERPVVSTRANGAGPSFSHRVWAAAVNPTEIDVSGAGVTAASRRLPA